MTTRVIALISRLIKAGSRSPWRQLDGRVGARVYHVISDYDIKKIHCLVLCYFPIISFQLWFWRTGPNGPFQNLQKPATYHPECHVICCLRSVKHERVHLLLKSKHISRRSHNEYKTTQ